MRYLLALALVLLAGVAEAVVPTTRAIGTITAGTGAISASLPAGTVTGDGLIAVIETRDNETSTAGSGTGCTANVVPYACCTGVGTGTCPVWTSLVSASGQSGGAGTGSKIDVLYKVAEANAAAASFTDSGNHTMVRIIGLTTGTFDDTCILTGSEARNAASTSISISGITTTKNDCLVFYGSSEEVDPAVQGNAECSSMSDANLSFMGNAGCTGSGTPQACCTGSGAGTCPEYLDNTRNAGDGGGYCVGVGHLATAGATGTWTVTHATSGVGGEVVFAICASCSTSTRRRSMVVQ